MFWKKPEPINNNSDLERRVRALEAIEEERKTVERIHLNETFNLMGCNPTARIRKDIHLTLEIKTGWGKVSLDKEQCMRLKGLLVKHFPGEPREDTE